MRGHNDTNWVEEHQRWIAIWKERHKYVLIGQPILRKIKHMNWYQENSRIFLTGFATYLNVIATSRLVPNMEIEQHPPQESPPVVSSMHDEGMPPHVQSYEFMPQPYHHEQDYKYNPQFFSVSGEDFMSNLMGTDLRTLEYSYVYM